MSEAVVIDTLRSLANGSISGSYAAVGTALTSPCRIICFTNNTDKDMLFSDDGINDKLFVAQGAFKLFDLTTNKMATDGFFAIRSGTQFYVKQGAAPSSGSVYIEVIYGAQ